jgi:hypothetical protein
MAHENSRTFELSPGRWINVDTVGKDGKQMSDSEAFRRAANKGDNILSEHKTVDEAVKAAEKRSKSFDGKR